MLAAAMSSDTPPSDAYTYGAWAADFEAAHQMAQSMKPGMRTQLPDKPVSAAPSAGPQLLLRVRPPTDGVMVAGVTGQLHLTTAALSSRHAPELHKPVRRGMQLQPTVACGASARDV